MKEKRIWQTTTCVLIVLCILLVYNNHVSQQLIEDYSELVDDYEETCLELIEAVVKYRSMALGNFSGWAEFNFSEPYPTIKSGESYNIWELLNRTGVQLE